MICLGPVVAPVELPCGHSYCAACLADLRSKDVAQTCPLCRETLPDGLEGLYALALRPYTRISTKVKRGEVSWESLPADEQAEMNDVLVMLTECAERGHADAQGTLAVIHLFGYGTPVNEPLGFEFAKKAAEQGRLDSMATLGLTYSRGVGCDHSYRRARFWLSKAVEGGFHQAKKELDVVQELLATGGLVDKRVRLYGLSSQALNGACGYCIDFGLSKRGPDGKLLLDSGRYTVRLNGSERRLVKVKPHNVAPFEVRIWRAGHRGHSLRCGRRLARAVVAAVPSPSRTSSPSSASALGIASSVAWDWTNGSPRWSRRSGFR